MQGTQHSYSIELNPKMVAEIPRVRVAIIGAGISGIAAAVQLKQLLGELDFVIYDRASSIGGVWQANTCTQSFFILFMHIADIDRSRLCCGCSNACVLFFILSQ